MFDICCRKLQRLAKDARSCQEKWGRQLSVEEIHVRGAQILRKLDGLGELQGLRKDVRRITVALERLAGIEGQ